MASSDRMRDLTVQVQRNNEDVHSYLRDLEGWQKDMEEKDNQLRGKASSSPGAACAGAVKTYSITGKASEATGSLPIVVQGGPARRRHY